MAQDDCNTHQKPLSSLLPSRMMHRIIPPVTTMNFNIHSEASVAQPGTFFGDFHGCHALIISEWEFVVSKDSTSTVSYMIPSKCVPPKK